MKHRGKIFEQAVRNSDFSITKITEKLTDAGLPTSQRHMYNLFENQNLSLDYFIQGGLIINHDFTNEIPELKKFVATFPMGDGKSKDPGKFRDKFYSQLEETNAWVTKYTQLLESKIEEYFSPQSQKKGK